ncbi:MAG: MerR family transcriptional regulator, partial [Flavobacteriales bacterium]
MPGKQTPILERFSIKDLEIFSGIKAHTIRAWERRHGLLKPSRSSTNIRSYGINDLRTILNISLLLKGGMSISQVSELSEEQRGHRIKEDIS